MEAEFSHASNSDSEDWRKPRMDTLLTTYCCRFCGAGSGALPVLTFIAHNLLYVRSNKGWCRSIGGKVIGVSHRRAGRDLSKKGNHKRQVQYVTRTAEKALRSL